jgi:hypothetical protein
MNIQENFKFGKLTIIKQVESYKSTNKTTGKVSCRKRYLSLCECGGTRIIASRYLYSTEEPCCAKCTFQKRPQSLKVNDNYIRHYKQLLTSARVRNLTCTLNFEQFKSIVLNNCYYCDEPPAVKDWGRERQVIKNGVDRVNNSKGYEFENCVACCIFCNTAKLTYSQEEFFNKIEKVYMKHINKNKNE